ncbi:MAG: hypothetical protein KatS3mg042_0702 [Rhodothermaceae bacterium]|nr:MAG: hypothetical protein KatS3mg042_0702 [Rhodothermaceae bacterium]
MRTFWREYGLILVLTLVGMGGYLFYELNRERLAVLSEELLNTRLMALAEGWDRPASSLLQLLGADRRASLAATTSSTSSSASSAPDAPPTGTARPPTAPAPPDALALLHDLPASIDPGVDPVRLLFPDETSMHGKLAGLLRFHGQGERLRLLIDEDAPGLLDAAERELFEAVVHRLERARRVLWVKHLAGIARRAPRPGLR